MRRLLCVPMMTLCLLLSACGGAGERESAASMRDDYHDISGCTMEATVSLP